MLLTAYPPIRNPIFFRLSALLLLLPSLRSLDADATEKLFFTGPMDGVHINSIIPYILQMKTSDFDSSFQRRT